MPHIQQVVRAGTEDVTRCGEFPRKNIQKRWGQSTAFVSCCCEVLGSAMMGCGIAEH